jgi:hypothetical protein
MGIDVKRFAVLSGYSSLGATSVQLIVRADSPNPETVPPTVVLAYFDVGNTLNACVSFAVTAFTTDTSVSPYNFKSTITLTAANTTTTWPAGENGTVSIKVSDGTTGALISTIAVTLVGRHLYYIPVTTATLTSV